MKRTELNRRSKAFIRNHSLRLTVAASLVLLTGCSDSGTEPQVEPDDGTTMVSFAADIQPIFDASCVGCHGAGGNGGLDLRDSASYDNLVGVSAQGHPGLRVDAGDPDASVLYQKMNGAGGVGNPMPPTGVLPAATVEKVRAWILAGAADN